MKLFKNLGFKNKARKEKLKEINLNRIRAFELKELSLEYGKEIKNFNKSLKLKDKKKYIFKDNLYPQFKGKDSRELLVRVCYNLFEKKEKSIESLKLITDFIKDQKIQNQAEYVKEFTKVFSQIHLRKERKEIEVTSNNFLKDLINTFNKKPVGTNYPVRLSYVKSIFSDFFTNFSKSSKYFKINNLNTKKPKIKHTIGRDGKKINN